MKTITINDDQVKTLKLLVAYEVESLKNFKKKYKIESDETVDFKIIDLNDILNKLGKTD